MTGIPVRHIHPKEPAFAGGFNIRKIKDLLGGQDLVQELHRHDFFFVLLLEKGSGKHEIDFVPYEVCDHSLIIMRPGQVHTLTLNDGSTGYLMQFQSDFHSSYSPSVSSLLRKAGKENFYQFETIAFEKLWNVFTILYQEYTHKREGFDNVIKAGLVIFFTELVRQQDAGQGSNESNYTQERFEVFMDLLERHVTAHKHVSEYADMMNVTMYQLNAITKKCVGKTCSDLINDQIVLEAKRFLLATTSQINEIAHRLGYDDGSYFIRFFKKQTGFTPEAFRQNFK
jgi:AraC-like DNA-binding protein